MNYEGVEIIFVLGGKTQEMTQDIVYSSINLTNLASIVYNIIDNDTSTLNSTKTSSISTTTTTTTFKTTKIDLVSTLENINYSNGNQNNLSATGMYSTYVCTVVMLVYIANI